jgi:hypothetical protein
MFLEVKKVKVTLEQATKGVEGEYRYSSTHSQPQRWEGEGGQHHALTALPPVKTWYPLYRRLGGPQARSGRVQKILPSPGFNPQTVQPIASRYTDWATWPTFLKYWQKNKGTQLGMKFFEMKFEISIC